MTKAKKKLRTIKEPAVPSKNVKIDDVVGAIEELSKKRKADKLKKFKPKPKK